MSANEADSANARQVGGDHYRRLGIQPWDAMEAWMSPEAFQGFLRGNAIKYLARCDAKGGIEDLKKARHYLDKLIEAQQVMAPADAQERQRRPGDVNEGDLRRVR